MLNKISFDEIRKVIDAQILELLSNAVQCEEEDLYRNARVFVLSAIELAKTAFNLGAIDRYDYNNIIWVLFDHIDRF